MNLKEIDWFFASYHMSYHLFLIIAIPLYLLSKTPPTGIIISTIILYLLTMIGITAGYHRYFSHRSYSTNGFVETILLLLATMAIQGSAFFWACTHRMHHRYTDSEQDPHNIKKGFFYAHMGWFLIKKDGASKMTKPVDRSMIPDLIANKLLQFQHKYYLMLSFGSNLIITIIIGVLFSDLLGAFIFTWWLRIFLVNHCVWFINSLAHTIGDKPYAKEQSAVDNFIMAILTLGEGYHNYHHAFPNDYRNSAKWYHFDPIKWFILLLHKARLVSSINRIDTLLVQKKLLREDKKMLLGRNLSDQDKKSIEAISDSLEQKLTQLFVLRKNDTNPENTSKIRKECRQEWNQWTRLVNRSYKNISD